ncbi:Uncharacterised protein [Klebsiella pneumoniae]|uniref:Uncharacterized protein n=1 Tax=Klebsiella pneumoniae TaxID=573 RepID=A0A377TJV4_KLEPN|nr:Uncharacterised protein [Klebsiella pneumoniae]
MGIRAKAGARVSGSESSFTSPTRRRREVKKRSGAVYRKGDHFADAFSAQRQHDHAVNAQRHAGAVRQTRLQRRQQVVIDGLLRKAARGAFAVILLKPQALFMGVGQLVETVRQLNTFVIDLKALSDPMIFRADLR